MASRVPGRAEIFSPHKGQFWRGIGYCFFWFFWLFFNLPSIFNRKIFYNPSNWICNFMSFLALHFGGRAWFGSHWDAETSSAWQENVILNLVQDLIGTPTKSGWQMLIINYIVSPFAKSGINHSINFLCLPKLASHEFLVLPYRIF